MTEIWKSRGSGAAHALATVGNSNCLYSGPGVGKLCPRMKSSALPVSVPPVN